MRPVRLTLAGEYGALAALSALLLLLIAGDARGAASLWGVLRALLAFFYLLFIPGYLLHVALFPRADRLDLLERVALSLGLSVALLPLVALVMDGLFIPLALPQITAAVMLLVLVLGALAWWRRARLGRTERFVWVVTLPVGFWRAQDRLTRAALVALAAGVLVGSVATVGILVLPRPGDLFTEFYLLGAAGAAADYPRALTVGDAATVTVGIINREGAPTTYRVEAILQDQDRIGALEPVTLDDGAGVERDLVFTPLRAGDSLYVDILLYRNDAPDPYRSLRLWLIVTPSR